MNKGFARFKKQSRRSAVIRSLVFGAAAGCSAGSVPILISKIRGEEISIPYALLIACLAFIAVFALFFAIYLPTNRRIARRLDRVLGLDEKVQTMLEFKDREGDMVMIQRESTDKLLQGIPLKKARRRHGWVTVIAPVLALTLLSVSLVIPAKAEEEAPPPPDSTYNLSAWQEQALKDLITTVRLSDMESAPKESTVITLETLLARLKAVKKESEMKTLVIEAIGDIYTSVNDHNTYDLIAKELQSSDQSAIVLLASTVEKLSYSTVKDDLDTLRNSVNSENVSALSAHVETKLKASGVVSTNELRQSLSSLFTSLDKT